MDGLRAYLRPFRAKPLTIASNLRERRLTGLLGYGGAYGAINNADLLLMLGTDFPFSEFLPGSRVKKVQVDQNPKHIGRRTSVNLGLVGDVKATVRALLESVQEKTDDRFLRFAEQVGSHSGDLLCGNARCRHLAGNRDHRRTYA